MGTNGIMFKDDALCLIDMDRWYFIQLISNCSKIHLYTVITAMLCCFAFHYKRRNWEVRQRYTFSILGEIIRTGVYSFQVCFQSSFIRQRFSSKSESWMPNQKYCAFCSRSEHEGSKRMKTELLVQMDGLARSDDLVFLLAASNLPW